MNLRRLDCLSSYHWRNFTLKSGGHQWRSEDLVSGGTTIEAPIGVGYGEGCPLPSGLGGLGERHELPQHSFADFRPQNPSGSKKNTILLPKV